MEVPFMSLLVAASSLKEFFKRTLNEAMSRHRLELEEVTEFYLVNLLADFVNTEKLLAEVAEGGRREHESLALLYHRALQQDREGRIKTFRRLGDVSLYRVGFFAESLRSAPVGADYYIQMGCTAYGQVAELTPQGGFAGVYRELNQKFRHLVEVLEEIAARGMVAHGPEGALKVYESWMRSGSDRLERVLVDAGVLVPKPGLPN